jgi:hypothetical protein
MWDHGLLFVSLLYCRFPSHLALLPSPLFTRWSRQPMVVTFGGREQGVGLYLFIALWQSVLYWSSIISIIDNNHRLLVFCWYSHRYDRCNDTTVPSIVLARPLPTNFNREEVPILPRPHSKNGLGRRWILSGL